MRKRGKNRPEYLEWSDSVTVLRIILGDFFVDGRLVVSVYAKFKQFIAEKYVR